jgi:16S rRNA (cytidine1402-2'-O)-methyltransferase
VPGTLFVVATPIGNLEDITYRAVRTLREVDLIACEDTRHSRRLLAHFGIDKPTISYHDYNESGRTADLAGRLLAGQNIALISDAGTPLISDPGFRIVQHAAAHGIPVIPIPGPSALIAALSASGLPTDSFYFGGFLPNKASQRRKTLEEAASLGCTVIFYEAPHRILHALEDVEKIFGSDRKVVLTREMTKLHEEFLRGTAGTVLRDIRGRRELKGELTLLIGKSKQAIPVEGSVRDAVQAYLDSGLPRMDAIKAVARDRGVPKREIYSAADNDES